MKRYLLDTNHFSALWRGDPRILDKYNYKERSFKALTRSI